MYGTGDHGGGASRRDIERLKDMQSWPIMPRIEFSTIENYSAIALVECGLGVSIMNKGVTLGRRNNVVMLPIDPPQFITIGVEILSLKAGSPAARKMISYVRKMLLSPTAGELVSPRDFSA